MGHVSQQYNRVSRSGTIVWMVGVKGQALAALGIAASVALQKRLLILCCLLCTQFYSPGTSAFHRPLLVPQRGIRWAIESSQTPSAVIIRKLQPSRDSLSAYSVAAVNCRARMSATSPPSLQVQWQKKKWNKKGLLLQFLLQQPRVCWKCFMATEANNPAVVASLVSLSFLSDSVMPFCVEGNLFKARASSFSHAHTISVLNHWTPLECLQSEHNLSFRMRDTRLRFTCRVSQTASALWLKSKDWASICHSM